MSEAGDFIDAALQYEVSPYVWPNTEPDGLLRYGTSVGAIRGTIRDAAKRYPGMSHDEVAALASELWTAPVVERRLAAIVLLQSNVAILASNDLTRIEGFIRSAGAAQLVRAMIADVLTPMFHGFGAGERQRALAVIRRWAGEADESLRAAAQAIGSLQDREF